MGSCPIKVYYKTANEYKGHFMRVYCSGPIITFDGIPVRFRLNDFDHCMYESSGKNMIKDVFSRDRAERIIWIAETLTNPFADLYIGWDKKKKIFDPESRVAVAYENFVVVIRHRKDSRTGELKGQFTTAYLADKNIDKIRSSPRWK